MYQQPAALTEWDAPDQVQQVQQVQQAQQAQQVYYQQDIAHGYYQDPAQDDTTGGW